MERTVLVGRLDNIKTRVIELYKDINSLKDGIEDKKDELVMAYATLKALNVSLSKIEFQLSEAIRHEKQVITANPQHY